MQESLNASSPIIKAKYARKRYGPNIRPIPDLTFSSTVTSVRVISLVHYVLDVADVLYIAQAYGWTSFVITIWIHITVNPHVLFPLTLTKYQ
jgi:hypothetical protein